MFLVHWLNTNTNIDYVRYYSGSAFFYSTGVLNDRGHLVLGVYYIVNGKLLTKEEYRKQIENSFKSIEELLLDIM